MIVYIVFGCFVYFNMLLLNKLGFGESFLYFLMNCFILFVVKFIWIYISSFKNTFVKKKFINNFIVMFLCLFFNFYGFRNKVRLIIFFVLVFCEYVLLRNFIVLLIN